MPSFRIGPPVRQTRVWDGLPLLRENPRTAIDHSGGIVVSTLRFSNGVLAVSLEDVWSGPRSDGYEDDRHFH
jgi:hypothetical protein